MKILDEQSQIRNEACVVVLSQGNVPMKFADIPLGSIFTENLGTISSFEFENYVLANLNKQQILSAISELNFGDSVHVEYWLLLDSAEHFVDLLGSINEFSMRSPLVEAGWAKFEVELSTKESSDSDLFLKGFQIGVVTSSRATVPVRSLGIGNPQRSTISGEVLSRIMMWAKPVKKYLPSRVIVVLYKILNWVR